jgi:hypothetical protein
LDAFWTLCSRWTVWGASFAAPRQWQKTTRQFDAEFSFAVSKYPFVHKKSVARGAFQPLLHPMWRLI